MENVCLLENTSKEIHKLRGEAGITQIIAAKKSWHIAFDSHQD